MSSRLLASTNILTGELILRGDPGCGFLTDIITEVFGEFDLICKAYFLGLFLNDLEVL